MRTAWCELIVDDKVSAAKSERSGITDALEQLWDGGTLVAGRLGRMGRSLNNLIARV